MVSKRVGVILNGVTGRMGTNQHLERSIVAIIKQGGVSLSSGDFVVPDPILIGRNRGKLQALAAKYGIERIGTDLDAALLNPDDHVYFDAATTPMRPENLRKAIRAGKHIYCEKPSAETLAEAVEIYTLAEKQGVKHGVVQDKLFLPGLLKVKRLVDQGFFGRVLSVRINFGYWVFTGQDVAAQRPSWNYQKALGGGIIKDMMCHWQYILKRLFGEIRSVSCLGAVHIPERQDERGEIYAADADDAFYATVEMKSGAIAQITADWCTRVHRRDLVTFQVDGTQGSAVAGLSDCWLQPHSSTPRPTWNPDQVLLHDFYADWQKMPDIDHFDNGFKVQWEMFLRYIAEDGLFPYDLRAGAEAVQLAELAYQSWQERRFIDIPSLEV